VLAAEFTRILLVGISNYRQPELQLRYAASAARDLQKALISTQGCSIPETHVVTLCDEQATRLFILTALRATASACSKDDIFIFYFSGHGERSGDGFYLLPQDAEASALGATTIELSDLQEALVQCQARGILLILDCCKSAGFAENADGFFRTLSGSEFRLLLSASRAGQLSYEYDQSASTFFTSAILDVLTGRAIIGKEPGIIYFSDLFEFIQEQVAEDLESSGQSAGLQEPVFAGTFTKDPRLFILSRLSLERLEAETPRYSRKFLRRRIQRILLATALSVLFALCAYYTYLDHSRYVWHEAGIVDGRQGDYLSIYAGDPRLNWLGFPHRIFTTDVLTTALPAAIRPGVGNPLNSRFSLDIEPVLFQQLNTEWKTAVSAWAGGRANDPWRYVSDLNPYDNPDASGLPQAIDGLATIASRNRVSTLEDLVTGWAPESSPAALKSIASLDPSHAVELISHSGDGDSLEDPRFTIALLEGVPAYCTQGMLDFLIRTAPTADRNSEMHNAWYGAAYRTGCKLPADTLFKKLNQSGASLNRRLDWIGALTRSTPPGFREALTADIQRRVALHASLSPESDSAYHNFLLLWTDLGTAAMLCPAALPPGLRGLLTSPFKPLRVAAAHALLVQDVSNKTMLTMSYASDPWILAVLAENGWFSNTAAESFLPQLLSAAKGPPRDAVEATDAVMYLMRAIRLRHLTDAQPFIQKISVSFQAPEVRIEAIRTQRVLLGPAAARDVSFSLERDQQIKSAPEGDLRLEKLSTGAFMDDSEWWFIRHDSRAYASFMAHLGDNDADAAQVLGRVPLPDSILVQMRQFVKSGNRILIAATVLAMRGSAKDLESLLTSADFNIRNQAERYAAYNRNFPAIAQSGSLQHFGSDTEFYLRKQLAIRSNLLQRIESLPDHETKVILLGILSNENSDASPGIQLMIQDAIDDLRGGSGYLGQNMDMDQLR
jgi:hypothetical protein